jgi:DNA-binding CsgD family transcriptional regulator
VVAAAALARACAYAARAEAEAVVEALAPLVAMTAVSDVAEPGIWPWPGLYAEALVDLGRIDEADVVLRPHEALAAARGRRSAVVHMARARGRIEAAAGRTAQARTAFAEGHRALTGLPLRFERALLRLAEGEALTTAKAYDEAVPILQSALETFIALGAAPYRERVDRALARCGRARGDAGRQRYRESLTSQESVIARLVADGRTNREVAAELFLSVKTVEFHLANVFRKLGIRSRRQLRTAL